MKKNKLILRIIASIAMWIVVITGTVFFIAEFWPSFPDAVMQWMHIPWNRNTLSSFSAIALVVVIVSYILMRER